MSDLLESLPRVNAPTQKPNTKLVSNAAGGQDVSRSSSFLKILKLLPAVIPPIVILALLWIFFVMTLSRPVAMPDSVALFIRTHAQVSTLIVAFVVTLLTAATCFSFSFAVRYVTAVRLAVGSVALDDLAPVNRVAQLGLWWHTPLRKWFCVFMVHLCISLQASTLISLLTVRQIPVRHNLTGHDLDMASPQLLQVGRSMALGLYDDLMSFFLQDVMIDAMQIKSRLPGRFNFNGYTYLSITGGIQPATYVPINNLHLSNNPGIVVPANLDDIRSSKHSGLPFNKTMSLTQQGFTADVDCQERESDGFDSLPTTWVSQNISINDIAYAMAELSVVCPGTAVPQSTGPVVFRAGRNIGGLLAVGCSVPNTTSYDIVFGSSGPYRLLNRTICRVTPKVTVVNVAYSNSPQNLAVPKTISVSQPISSIDVPVWGRMAVEALLHNILLGQSMIGSTMGNAWLLTPGAHAGVPLPEVMNTYIKAAIEFTGTVIRQVLTQPDSPFLPGGWGVIPESMRSQIKGTFVVTTYGWHQERQFSWALLIPTTLVVMGTYALFFYGFFLACRNKDSIHPGDVYFDCTEIVHLVAAQAAWTRENFKTFSSEENDYRKGIQVQMGLNEAGISVLRVEGRNDVHVGGQDIGGHDFRSARTRDSGSVLKFEEGLKEGVGRQSS